MNQEVNLSIKLGDLSLSSDISATFVINGPDQVVTGIKEFEDGIDIGDNNRSLGHGCLAVGNELTVGSYNFFYKGIQLDVRNLSAKIFLTAEQPRYPFPMIRINNSWSTFRIDKQDINIFDTSTFKKLSGNGLTDSQTHKQLSSIWLCLSSDDPNWVAMPHRGDYNQLCIDLGEYYRDNLVLVQNKLSDYFSSLFLSPYSEDGLSQYNLSDLTDEPITMVNNDKINYLRCGQVFKVENGCILDVKLSSFCVNHLSTNGIQFNDFDYDDASLVFIDKPTLSGPANSSTYSSLNVGAENTCLRRCSMTVGKQNLAESDFAVALGRRAKAKNYSSFVWGPATEVESPKSYTFTVGQRDWLSNLIKPSSGNRTLYVGTNHKESTELHKFMLSCIAEDTSLLSYLTQKLSNQKFTKIQVGNEVATTGASSIAVGAGNTKAYGWCSIAVGNNANSLTSCCAAFGQNLSAVGYNSFVVGRDSKALSTYSIAFGTNACAEHDSSFVWNSTTKEYKSNGSKTFNLNPSDGLSGVFIGKDNFIQCVLSAVSQMNGDQLNTLKRILGIS